MLVVVASRRRFESGWSTNPPAKIVAGYSRTLREARSLRSCARTHDVGVQGRQSRRPRWVASSSSRPPWSGQCRLDATVPCADHIGGRRVFAAPATTTKRPTKRDEQPPRDLAIDLLHLRLWRNATLRLTILRMSFAAQKSGIANRILQPIASRFFTTQAQFKLPKFSKYLGKRKISSMACKMHRRPETSVFARWEDTEVLPCRSAEP